MQGDLTSTSSALVATSGAPRSILTIKGTVLALLNGYFKTLKMNLLDWGLGQTSQKTSSVPEFLALLEKIACWAS